MDAYKSSVTKEAEELLEAFPQRIAHVHQLLQTHFKERKPSQVHAVFAQTVQQAQLEFNPTMQPLTILVADELENVLVALQKVGQWIQLLVPKVADGNNFGVEVQKSVHTHVKEAIANWQKVWDSLVDYHNQRATAIEKVKDKISKEKSVTTTVTESKGGKDGDENKSVKSTVDKETATSAPPVQDWVAYVAAVDMKWYFNLARTLEGIRDQYALTSDIIEKNKEKVLQPRSNADRGGYSMY